MKLTVEIGRDEELRKEIINLIRTEIRNISGEEIREMVKQCMNEQNIPARVVSAFKDLVTAELDRFSRGYGRMTAEKIIKDKFQDIVENHFDSFFEKKAMPFLKDYVTNNLESISGTVNIIKNILGDRNGKNKKDL